MILNRILIESILLLILGLALTLYGYRLFKTLLWFLGLAVGAGAGQYICNLFQWHGWPAVAVIVGLGLIGAFLALGVYTVGLFLFGAFLGYAVSQPVTLYFPGVHPLLVIVVLALLAGILMLKLERPLIIVCTVLAGAWTTLAASFALWTGTSAVTLQHGITLSPAGHVLWIAAGCILIALGLSAQIGWTGKKRPA